MKGRRTGLMALLLLTASVAVQAETAVTASCPELKEGLYPAAPVDAQVVAKDISWNRWLLDCVPPLQHARGKRWPLVFWHGPQWHAVTDAELKAFADRGMVPTVRLNVADIPKALRLQRLGLPVIALEAKGVGWPYDLGGAAANWTLDLPPGKQIPDAWRHEPDPLRLDLWAKGADQLRTILHAYQVAGVNLDAAWLDYEGQPSVLNYQALLASTRARAKLPPAALATPEAFHAYRRQLWLQLMSSYVAAPIREFYPAASVTNWIVMLSSASRPVLSWDNWRQPDLSASLFTATNPVAYGVDSAFWSVWQAGHSPDQAGIDQVYMHLMLRQSSVDAANRAQQAPYLHAVPWVARWVRDLRDRQTPVMSRSAYREALRHLWLRGAAAMQVFNPLQAGHFAESLAEVQDAVAVYDELLPQRAVLDEPQVMNTTVPEPGQAGLLWSGLRDDQRALVRLYPVGATSKTPLQLVVWPQQTVVLPQPLSGGQTYLIERGEAGQAARYTPWR